MAGIWVGPPMIQLRRVGGGSSRVKTEPPQIVLLLFLLLLFLTMVNEEVMHMSTQLHVFIGHATENRCQVTWESDSRRLQHPWSPRALTAVSARGLKKWALKSTEDEREKCRKNPSSPTLPRHKHRHKNSVHGIPALRCMVTGTSTTPPVVAQRRAFTLCPRTATSGPPQFSVHLAQTPFSSWTPCSIAEQALHRRLCKQRRTCQHPAPRPTSTSPTPLPQRRTH